MYSSELRKSRSQSGLRLDEKTRCRPSGVHAAADEWLKSPEVTCTGVPPSAETTKMWVWPKSRYPTPSCVLLKRSSMIGGAAHSAPAGGFGGAARLGGACGTSMLKAIWRPSGDQRMPLGDSVSWVSVEVSPVSIHRTCIWPSAM